jgi:hypothetical protein
LAAAQYEELSKEERAWRAIRRRMNVRRERYYRLILSGSIKFFAHH